MLRHEVISEPPTAMQRKLPSSSGNGGGAVVDAIVDGAQRLFAVHHKADT